MFSLDKFYQILHDNLISKTCTNNYSTYFFPFGTYDYDAQLVNSLDFSPLKVYERHDNHNLRGAKIYCYFLDQEPLTQDTPVIGSSYDVGITSKFFLKLETEKPRLLIIVATSEKSYLKTNMLKLKSQTVKFYDWYYFYHGFAALDWYRDFQYVEPTLFDKFSKVFICYNNLISDFRAYRLHLVSNLLSQDLVRHGLVSCRLEDNISNWKKIAFDKESPLDINAKKKILQEFPKLKGPLVIDTDTPDGTLSASINFNDATKAFWHIVTETVYFLPKLHLTEKTFKPIAVKRPFILVAAPGNLAYLKSYGFKTFDRWIDESYDQEQDHYVRIEKITAEIKRLCELSPDELRAMYEEMKPVLEYNYDYFFNGFKEVIVNELVDNFDGILSQFNNGRQPNNHSRYHHRFELSKDYLQEVKQRLLK
jgi:hypothetical protein